MTITRNGQEFELTNYELMQAHTEYEHSNAVLDIISSTYQEDTPEDVVLDDSDFDAMAELLQKYLSRNDGYWDAYWASVNEVIKSYVEERVSK